MDLETTLTSFSGLAANCYNPWKTYCFGSNKLLSSSTVAAIARENTWAIRFDLPHPGVPYPHVNFRHRFTGVRDPHMPISETAVGIFGVTNKTINTLSDYMQAIYLASVAYRIGKAAYQDLQNCDEPRNTVETTTKIAAEYTGGLVGAVVGSKVLGLIGGSAMGLCTGGVGVLAATAVCSIAGGVVGGVQGSLLSRQLVDDITYDDVKNTAYDATSTTVKYVAPVVTAGASATLAGVGTITYKTCDYLKTATT